MDINTDKFLLSENTSLLHDLLIIYLCTAQRKDCKHKQTESA
jgi:hypothetical protein